MYVSLSRAPYSGRLLTGWPVFGLGFLPSSDNTTLNNHPALTSQPGLQPMAGSLMIIRAKDLDAAWARIKDDVYWTGNVWDKEAMRIEQLISHPDYIEA